MINSTLDKERVGVLLVGHGTRDPNGTVEFFQIGEKLSAELGDRYHVVPCLLEFQEPTIAQAWAMVAESGCRRVVVAPLLLFAAGHAKSDIPEEVATARRLHPTTESIDMVLCPPISRQPHMVDAVRERLSQVLGRGSNEQDNTSSRTAIVMVGRGSRDVCASADMRLLSEIAVMGRIPGESSTIGSQWNIDRNSLFTTFYAMAEPRLPDTLDQVASSGRFDRVIVHPHLLFSGRLYDAIQRQVDEAASKFAKVEFCVSDYLGPVEKVAQAVGSRIRASAEPNSTRV